MNDCGPMLVTPAGIVTSEALPMYMCRGPPVRMKPFASASLTHIRNAPASIRGMFAGNVTFSSSRQYPNANCPMLVTLSGMVTPANGGNAP